MQKMQKTQKTQTHDSLIDIKSLSGILSQSPRTLRNKLCACPDTLPPRVIVPGVRGPRWRISDVDLWLAALSVLQSDQKDTADRADKADKADTAARPGRRRRIFNLN
jgi:hypothetical protein